MMSDELQNKLVNALISQRDKGKTPTEAVENLLLALGAHYHDVARISVLNAKLIGEVLISVYQDKLAALELASLLRNMHFAPPEIASGLHANFTAMDAQTIASLLLHEQVYPQCNKEQIREALHYVRFSDHDCDQALAALFPA